MSERDRDKERKKEREGVRDRQTIINTKHSLLLLER